MINGVEREEINRTTKDSYYSSALSNQPYYYVGQKRAWFSNRSSLCYIKPFVVMVLKFKSPLKILVNLYNFNEKVHHLLTVQQRLFLGLTFLSTKGSNSECPPPSLARLCKHQIEV